MATPGVGITTLRGREPVVLAVFGGVVLADQATKWWAWRHVMTVVNPGATGFLWAGVSVPFAAPVTGALLDLAGLALLSLAMAALVRRPRPRPTLVGGTALIAGWTSNVLDRLGLHALTAPHSGRGAVDFIHLGRLYYNVADLCIAGGTALLLVVALLHGARRRVPPSRLAAAGTGVACMTAVLVLAGSLQPAAAVVADRDQRLRASSGSRSSPNSSRSTSA